VSTWQSREGARAHHLTCSSARECSPRLTARGKKRQSSTREAARIRKLLHWRSAPRRERNSSRVIPQRLGTLAVAATLQPLLVPTALRAGAAKPPAHTNARPLARRSLHNAARAKNAPLRHFYAINDHFTKAGSGQTWEKEMRFLQENRISRETQPGVLYTIAPSSHALLLLCVLLNNEDGGFGSSHAAKMSARSSLSRREDRRVQQRLL
jgi:hypothetical protein